MTPEDVLTVLRRQRARGPLPSTAEGLSGWIAALEKRLPPVGLELPLAADAVSRLRAVGLVVEEDGGKTVLRFCADGDALDRILALLGLPVVEGGGAAALLAAIDRQAQVDNPPALSLPLRIQPAKACSLGWSSDLFSLTVLISNVTLREQDGALLPADGRPVVAICAEYDRPLTSLDPPSVADYRLGNARVEGVPLLRLAGGWLRSRPRLEPTTRLARAAAGRPEAVARAERFLEELGKAWKQRIGSALQVAWPVYRSERAGPLLDAVVGRPLPEMQLV